MSAHKCRYVTASSGGSYAHCQCGERFGPYRSPKAASVAWAEHVAATTKEET